jgi:hypothetical protein
LTNFVFFLNLPEDVHVKTVDRSAQLAAIAEGVELKRAETVDKSGPQIEGKPKVKYKIFTIACL